MLIITPDQGENRGVFSIFFNMKVYCVFSLESPQYTIFNMKKEKHPKLSQICSYRIFSQGLKNEFETAVVNEPSVFEPQMTYIVNYRNTVT